MGQLLCCLDGRAAASVEELEGGSMLAYVGLLVLGYLFFSVATGVFAQALSAAIVEPLGGYWGGGWWVVPTWALASLSTLSLAAPSPSSWQSDIL